MEVAYNYKDILLQPKYSELESRSQADTSVQFGPRRFALPIVPANMATIIDEKLAVWLAQNDYFYIMHRFNVDSVQFCKNMRELGLYTSISLGVNEDSYQVLEKLIEEHISPDYLNVDIAHGMSRKMELMVSHINEARYRFPWFQPFVIGGNVCTPEGIEFLENCGVDSCRAGIGPGSVCLTLRKTGFSHPQFSAVLNCAKVAKKPLIADGGIEHNGDLAKALVAGATMVMAGGIFAGHSESPGNTITIMENGHEVKYREFYGSASEHNKSEKKNIEGRKILVPFRGPIKDKFDEIKQDLQSSISYAGGNDLKAFNSVKWVVVH